MHNDIRTGTHGKEQADLLALLLLELLSAEGKMLRKMLRYLTLTYGNRSTSQAAATHGLL